MTEIKMSDPRLSFTGRIDFTNAQAPLFIWAGSFVEFAFIGTDAVIEVDNKILGNGRTLGYVVDGKEYKSDLSDGVQNITLIEDGENIRHEITVFKRMESGHYFSINKLMLNDNAVMCEAPEKPKRRIEVYGDSVSAGEVCEAVDYTGKTDPENNIGQWDNAWQSYVMKMARALPAEVYDTSQGGLSLFDNTGYFEQPNTKGLEFTYNKLKYNPRYETSEWDFNRFVPHVIIIAIGQNDAFPNPDCLKDKEYYEKWVSKYIEIVRMLHKKSGATFILANTVLMHDRAWDDILEDIKNRLQSEINVYHFMYKRNGAATPGHPRIPEQQEMADELTEFLNSLPQSTWDD